VVTITGTNFTAATAVSFGGTAASSYTVVSATSITAVVGAGATGNVSVMTANGAVTRAGFIYLPPPTITTFSPTLAGTDMKIVQFAKNGMVNPSNELNGEFSEKPEVNAKEITHIDWELFPNPSDGIINLSVKFSNLVETGVLSIRDINGRVVKSVTNVRTGTYQIDLSSEPKGTYLFSLQDENGKELIIKQIILN
jgi:hypothetical protein